MSPMVVSQKSSESGLAKEVRNMSIIQNITDKLTSGNKMRYILTGTLVLVIVITLLSVVLGLGSKKRVNYKPKDMHFFCMETEKEFVLTPEDIKKMTKEKEGKDERN